MRLPPADGRTMVWTEERNEFAWSPRVCKGCIRDCLSQRMFCGGGWGREWPHHIHCPVESNLQLGPEKRPNRAEQITLPAVKEQWKKMISCNPFSMIASTCEHDRKASNVFFFLSSHYVQTFSCSFSCCDSYSFGCASPHDSPPPLKKNPRLKKNLSSFSRCLYFLYIHLMSCFAQDEWFRI